MIIWQKKKKTNYGKIIGITAIAVTGACAVSYFVYKLVEKLRADAAYDYDEDLCEDCPLADECNGDCPIEEFVEETEVEEPAAPAEQE